MNPTCIVYYEVGSDPEQPDMVGQPLSHPLGAQVPIQRRPTVEIVVFGAGCEKGSVHSSGTFCQHLNGVGEVEVAVSAAGSGGIKEQFSTLVVSINRVRESTIDDDDGVNTTIAPIGKDLEGGGVDGVGGVEERNPLALVCGMSKDVKRLGG